LANDDAINARDQDAHEIQWNLELQPRQLIGWRGSGRQGHRETQHGSRVSPVNEPSRTFEQDWLNVDGIECSDDTRKPRKQILVALGVEGEDLFEIITNLRVPEQSAHLPSTTQGQVSQNGSCSLQLVVPTGHWGPWSLAHHSRAQLEDSRTLR
jgi:hypothetical protein